VKNTSFGGETGFRFKETGRKRGRIGSGMKGNRKARIPERSAFVPRLRGGGKSNVPTQEVRGRGQRGKQNHQFWDEKTGTRSERGGSADEWQEE